MAELIVALDLPTKELALKMANELKSTLNFCKVGLELFTHNGPDLVKALQDLGFKIFLDLKFYDIPHTVARAVKCACDLKVDLLTLHVQGSVQMLTAARNTRDAYREEFKSGPELLGVTVLTSFTPGEIPGIGLLPSDFAHELAGIANRSKIDGVVCAVEDLKRIKTDYPNLKTLCPG
ncbi:MAG: orotidine-5'-phosphate decarboxylase, partial [Desulfovibrionaceae bacterium]|nr:orotidine-5'-phosphate decarboxylase [Desulfovibrionaceae bacterium]